MNKDRQTKEAKVAEIREKLGKAQAIVLVDYQGLAVEEDTALRKTLREAGVEYRVYKNNLIILAAKGLGIEGLDSYSEGPVLIVFEYEDATTPARILYIFARDHKKLELEAGAVEGALYNKEEVEELVTIPLKEALIIKLLGSSKAPLSNVVYLLNVIKERKEPESAG